MSRLMAALLFTLLAAISSPSLAEPRFSVVRSEAQVNLLVAEAGNPGAPAILFIHGFAQSHLAFRRQFQSDLADRFHLVAFDLRGHGGSSKPDDATAYTDIARSADDVAAVIRAKKLTRPVIVGWSYGGLVVGDFLRKYGRANVSGVVFAGTMGGLASLTPPNAPALAEVASAMRSASEMARSLDLKANVEAARVISEAYFTPTMSDEDRRILLANELMLPAYVRRAAAKRPSDHSTLIPLYARLPMMMIRGEYELGMPEAVLTTLAAKLPRLTISRYSGVGHLTFFEEPGRFNAELAQFVVAAKASRPGPAIQQP